MATKAAVSLEEYLRTPYGKPNPEYRDGEVVSRSIPTYLHGVIQGMFFALFLAVRKRFAVFPSVETRLILGPDKVYVADVCLFAEHEPAGPHPSIPPHIVVEVLSPDDRMGEVRAKLEDYRQWGARCVWLADPESRRLYTCGEQGLAEVTELEAPEFELRIVLADLFGVR